MSWGPCTTVQVDDNLRLGLGVSQVMWSEVNMALKIHRQIQMTHKMLPYHIHFVPCFVPKPHK